MASIQRKIIHGRPYYYLVESRRVNGRPRPIVLAYLGSPDTLLQRLQQQVEPSRARLTHFGGIAALYDLAQQLHLVELIDQFAPKRRQGPSLGQYMLVAAINRCLEPTSKLQMPAWLRSTPLPRWMGLAPQQFSAQRFWDNMDLLDESSIAAISQALAQRLMDTCHLDVRSLIFDCTNFDTFIDTENPQPTPATRSRQKQTHRPTHRRARPAGECRFSCSPVVESLPGQSTRQHHLWRSLVRTDLALSSLSPGLSVHYLDL